MRTEAGVGAVTGELCGGAAVFFSAAAFNEFCLPDAADGFGVGGVSRRAGGSAGFCCAADGADAVEVGDEELGRRLRIFGSARIATITRSAAARGTT